ncbi:uncharacterized protein G2W53_007792 [Senna tora]|uniref:Uncharacterized protein n=1 Tax=Senna tora TaxID=362788 RepID=A0A835CG56_9FABA|nr:uncharacterized protein G2W53_007792 [Senna tora]
MENPRAQTYQEETKAVTTLRSGKIIDNKNSERTWYMVRTLIFGLQENLSYNSPESILNFSAKSNLMDQFMKAHDYPRKFLEVHALKLKEENVK